MYTPENVENEKVPPGKEGLESIKQQQPTAYLLAGKTDQVK
jgi:hypothetical protein